MRDSHKDHHQSSVQLELKKVFHVWISYANPHYSAMMVEAFYAEVAILTMVNVRSLDYAASTAELFLYLSGYIRMILRFYVHALSSEKTDHEHKREYVQKHKRQCHFRFIHHFYILKSAIII